MNTYRVSLKAFVIVGVALFVFTAEAGEVKQLTFGGYNRDQRTCNLSELGFINNPGAKTYSGRIAAEGSAGRAALCNVSIPRSEFDRRYQYCALASIETIRPTGYVCEVFHFKESVVFSYAHGGPSSELPMCSFVCPAP